MKNIVAMLAGLLVVETVLAWNLGAKNVNALEFERSGRVSFTLFDAGLSGKEFKCGSGGRGQWLTIASCEANDGVCLAATNRMSSLLLSAKLASKKVLVQRSGCTVSGVALKP